MRSKSHNVNRYVDTVIARRALAAEFQRLHREEIAANGALRGKHLREADAILKDVVRLAEDYAVEVKVRRVTPKKPKKNACPACGGNGKADGVGDVAGIYGSDNCGACGGSGKAVAA